MLYQFAFAVSTTLRCHIAGRFHRSLYPYTFFLGFNVEAVCSISDTGVILLSVLGLDVSLLRLLEVDNIPDGIEILPEKVSTKRTGSDRQGILHLA